MAIKAVVFDIGGVLEYTPRTGWMGKWENRLGLEEGEIGRRLGTSWRAGSIGTTTLETVENDIRETLKLSPADLVSFMADLWEEYVGSLNVEMTEYFAGLRARYQTAIISNSFVGAREREEELYHFGEMCDLVVYSHEVGMSKPDPRIFEICWTQLGIQPGEMVFLDDVEGHIQTARSLGIKGVVFRDNAQAIAEVERLLTAS
jgi:putative hydrolase of the HAD superfamily